MLRKWRGNRQRRNSHTAIASAASVRTNVSCFRAALGASLAILVGNAARHSRDRARSARTLGLGVR